MKIICITNTAQKTPQEAISHYASQDSTIPLIVEKKYIVYAVSEYYQNTWFCICDENYTYHPMWIPQHFFELVDNRISRFWVFSFKEDLDKNRFFLGFPEWANQPDYYDNLTDGEEREVSLFRSYRELMDLEFPDDSISDVAQIGDELWLICPLCISPWENSEDRNGMVICPACKKVMHNPRYKNIYPHL